MNTFGEIQWKKYNRKKSYTKLSLSHTQAKILYYYKILFMFSNGQMS